LSCGHVSTIGPALLAGAGTDELSADARSATLPRLLLLPLPDAAAGRRHSTRLLLLVLLAAMLLQDDICGFVVARRVWRAHQRHGVRQNQRVGGSGGGRTCTTNAPAFNSRRKGHCTHCARREVWRCAHNLW
jgi:hypothetical protein